MNKKIINVPHGTKHLSEWKGMFEEIPMDRHLILNKRICGCGATEAFLRTDKKVILASPRKHLLFNKYSQHLKDNFHLFRYTGDNDKYLEGLCEGCDLASFLSTMKSYVNLGGTKILTTYDSLAKIHGVLPNPDEWIVVVDEFQVQFYDCHYKAETELQFCEALKGFKSVIYLSATPFLEKYLDMIEPYKNLTMYELSWGEDMTETPNVELVKTKKSVLDLCSDIIGKYRNGNGRTINIDGTPFVSCEAVFYINNVSEILKVVKKNDLDPSEVTIICSSTSENKKKIAELNRTINKKFCISEVPGKNDRLKMFTFCTSTVYVGADFYSTNAYSYIFSNPKLGCMTLDVSVDLQQIIGRQRLEENPFRNSATLYFNTKMVVETEEDLDTQINEKKCKTQRKIENYDSAPHKSEALESLEKDIKGGGHKSHYCCVITDSQNNTLVVNNQFLEVADRRAWEVSNKIYNGDFSMYQALKEGANVNRVLDSDDSDLQKLFALWTENGSFERKAKLYCDMMEHIPDIIGKCNFIERKYIDYYNALGKTGMEELNWRECEMKKALLPETFKILPKNEIHKRLSNVLLEGKEYSKSWVKEQIKKIYANLGIEGNPSASDIFQYMTVKESSFREVGKKVASFKIISHLRKNVSLFSSITETHYPETYDIDSLLDVIKGGKYFQLEQKVENVRNSDDPNGEKKKLPACCWNGVFSERAYSKLTYYSSFTVLDFDHVEGEQLMELKEKVKGFEFVYAGFISPSGKGYKAVVLHDNFEPKYHTDMYKQLLSIIGTDSSDESTKDLARANYLSYDPDLWINPNSKPFHYEPSKSKEEEEQHKTETVIKDDQGNDALILDDSPTTRFLNMLSKTVVSDESVIRMLRKVWTGESLKNGRNNTALAYAGVLCKAGVEKDLAKNFIEELIPNFEITEIVDYAYKKNVFCCERRKYNKRK